MATILFVLGGGIGNLVQATPAIRAAAKAGHVVDLLLHCKGTKGVKELFRIQCVRHVYEDEAPAGHYDFQLRGPWTPDAVHNADSCHLPRVNHAQHLPEAEIYYDLVKQIGVNIPMDRAEVNIGNGGYAPATGDTVAIYPGCKPDWPMKRWDKYDLLAQRFERVLITGSPGDINSHHPAWFDREWNWPSHAKLFTGDLQHVARVLSKCGMFIGNDGGLSHVASATGIPTFVLFGPSSPTKNKPFGRNAHAIGSDIPCRPCQFKIGPDGRYIFKNKKTDCPLHMKCLKDLTVDFVVAEIQRVLPEGPIQAT